MSESIIRVGIIGAGGWAKYGHIPALQSLPGFEVRAVAARSTGSAQKCAEAFGIPRAYNNADDLIGDDEIDLVCVLTPAPDHAQFVRAAISAGKDVYSEWPLTTTTTIAEELLGLAEAAGVRHLIGLQRRLGPSARYVRDLVRQGYVGDLRSARIAIGTDAFVPLRSERISWSFDAASFSNAVSIYVGHHTDTLFQLVGRPKQLTAVAENQFPFITVEETGQQIPNENPDAVVIAGTLERGGLFGVHIEGGQKHQTGLQIDITGTEGVLRLVNDHAFQNPEDNRVLGISGAGMSYEELAVPADYNWVPDSSLDVSVTDVAHLYTAYARDKATGSNDAPTFKDAVRQHQLIDQVLRSSAAFFATG